MKAMSSLGLVLIAICCQIQFGLAEHERVSDKDYNYIASKVEIRLFTPKQYDARITGKDMWNSKTMGTNIKCTINNDALGTATVTLPREQELVKSYPTKVVTHGFMSSMKKKTAFVTGYMKKTNNKANVILVNWSPLAKAVYETAALRAIDVGNYIGRCMAALHKDLKVDESNLHFIGHSLGAHLMGKAGRVFTYMTISSKMDDGYKVSRVTGLDPAGPRFVNGPDGWFSDGKEAIRELNVNRINKESADFVDIIHSNGDVTPSVGGKRLGDLHKLGHLDFYPNGGESQPGCTGFFGNEKYLGKCSHTRAIAYFIFSITRPRLFKAVACSSRSSPQCEKSRSQWNVANMGDPAEHSQLRNDRLYVEVREDIDWSKYDAELEDDE